MNIYDGPGMFYTETSSQTLKLWIFVCMYKRINENVTGIISFNNSNKNNLSNYHQLSNLDFRIQDTSPENKCVMSAPGANPATAHKVFIYDQSATYIVVWPP